MSETVKNILKTLGVFILLTILFKNLSFFILLGAIIYLLWKTKVVDFNAIVSKFKETSSKTTKKEHVINYETLKNIKPKRMIKLSLKTWGIIIGSLIVLFIILDGLVSVPAGNVAVIYDRGRGVLSNALPEGLHLKIPFWQVATIMDTRLQAYTMSIADDEGYFAGDDSIESLTKDGQKVYVDATIQYKINREDASWIYQNIGSDEIYLAKVVRPGTRNVVRDVITGFDSTNLFTQDTRLEAQKQMKDKLTELFGKNKVQLDDVLLRNIQFSETYLQAIEDKQVAQQRIQKADYEKQEAEKIKERKIIEAEAEQQAISLKGQALRQNPEVIQLEFVQKMAPNISWGVLPSSAIPFFDMKNLMGSN